MKLFKYLAIVILSSLAIASIGSWIINRGLKKSGVDFFGKMNAIGDTSAKMDILLIGSSRTLIQIDPAIIDSVTGLRSFNYGMNAATIKTCFNIIQYGLLKQSASKMVVLNIDYTMFNSKGDLYKDPFFYPYQNEVPSLLMTDSGMSKNIHQLKAFDVSLYDDLVKYAAIDGFIRPGRTIPGVYKGFYPHTAVNDFKAPLSKQIEHTNVVFSENEIGILQQIIELCNKQQKKLVLVVAPYANKYFPAKYIDNYYYIINKVKAVAAASQVPLLDYTGNAIADRYDYFYNVNHLNINGAKAYTGLLAHDIEGVLKKTNNQ